MKPRVMSLPTLPPGFIWQNVAPLGADPDWKQIPMPADWNRTTSEIIDDSERLFGYRRAEFMAKQYRRGTAA